MGSSRNILEELVKSKQEIKERRSRNFAGFSKAQSSLAMTANNTIIAMR